MRRFDSTDPGYGLGVLATLTAARDFGLDPMTAAEIAYSVDPRLHGFDTFVEALANALLESGLVSLPRLG